MVRPVERFFVLAITLSAPCLWADDAVTFHRDVLPIFRTSCIGCHGGKRPKSKLSLETYASAMKGGREGAAVEPGKPDESLLFLLVTGTEEPLMPPEKKGEKLASPAIEIIRRWIEGGCVEGDANVEPPPYARPLSPPEYHRAPAIRALAYSADGQRLFVAAFKEIVVHDARWGEAIDRRLPIARYLGEAEQLNALELSPDGKLLAAAGGNPARFGELQLWNVERGALERWTRIGQDSLYGLAFSPDGARIAIGGTDRAIHLLDVENGEELYAAEVHADWVFGLAFPGDGDQIVSGSRDKTVKISAASSGELVKNLATDKGQVLRVVARPGSTHVLAAGESRVPVLYDQKAAKQVRKFETQPGAVLAAAFSADGKTLALGGAASEVRVYNADNGKRLATLSLPEKWTYAIAVNPDGKTVAVSGYEGRVRVFQTSDGKQVADFVPVPIGRRGRF